MLKSCDKRFGDCPNNNLGYCNKFKKWKRTELSDGYRIYVRLLECRKEEFENNKVVVPDTEQDESLPF